MRPLLKAAFWCGLCPVGPPPTYEPSLRAVTFGVLMALVWFFANGGLVVWDFVADTPPPATFGLNDTTLMPRGMQRVIRSSSSAASILGFLGLSIGYMRKWRHLPRAFQMKRALPGKPRWKKILFIAELSVFGIPVSAYLLESFYERRGVSNTGTFAALGTLYSLEKFMFLHLVAIVGVIYGEINASLQGLEDKESRTRFRQVDESLALGEEARPAVATVRDDVRLLRQQHMAACELLELVTRSYEVQVLSILVCEFVLSVLVLYMQARSVLQHATRPTDLVAILFLLLTTQVTTLIYDTCRSTSNKGNKTPRLIHKLLNSRKFFGEEVEQLVLFSMQLTNRKVCVSPYDVVTMDYTLLHGMLCNVTMHIVILVQFNLT